MRDVSVVKEKRDELVKELGRFMKFKNENYTGFDFSSLSAHQRREYSYIMSTMGDLRGQINAIEYVLNEDTELRDATWVSSPYLREKGITKEDILGSKKDGATYRHKKKFSTKDSLLSYMRSIEGLESSHAYENSNDEWILLFNLKEREKWKGWF